MRWERVLAKLILEQTQALWQQLRRAFGSGDLGRAKADLDAGYRQAHRTGMGWAVLDLLNARIAQATQRAIEERLRRIGVSLEVTQPEVLGRLEGQIRAAQDRLEAARDVPGAPARAAGYAVRWGVQQGVADVAESAIGTAEGEELELLKVWVRLAARMEHRTWHDALEGVTIPYSRKFILVGPNGTFEVERPYDPVLPISEKIGCGHGIRVILPEGADRLTLGYGQSPYRPGADSALDLSQEPIRFVPDEAPNPPAKPRASRFRAVGPSIREALVYGPRVPFSGRLARALDAIASVHGSGLFPPLPIRMVKEIVDDLGNRGVGAYVRTPGGQPARLEFLKSGDWEVLDVPHEVGHLFDHQVAGVPGEYTSERRDGPLAPVMEALLETTTVKKLAAERQSGWVVIGGRRLARADDAHLEYLLRPKELFARAYAQYVAVTSGDADMLAQVGRRRDGPGGELWYPYQWGDEEFEPVAQALERVLRDLRLTE